MELLNYDVRDMNSKISKAVSKQYTKEISQLESLDFVYVGDDNDEYDYWYVPEMTHEFGYDDLITINFPGIYDGEKANYWHIEYDKDSEVISEKTFKNFNDLVKFITEG